MLTVIIQILIGGFLALGSIACFLMAGSEVRHDWTKCVMRGVR